MRRGGGGWPELCSDTAEPGKLHHHEQNEAAQSQDGGHEPQQEGQKLLVQKVFNPSFNTCESANVAITAVFLFVCLKKQKFVFMLLKQTLCRLRLQLTFVNVRYI